jgi:hypothetical protein
MRAQLLGVLLVTLGACEVHMNDGKPAQPPTGAAPAPAPAPGPVPVATPATPAPETPAVSQRRVFNPNRTDPTAPTPVAVDAGTPASADAGTVVVNDDAGSGVSTSAKKK